MLHTTKGLTEMYGGRLRCSACCACHANARQTKQRTPRAGIATLFPGFLTSSNLLPHPSLGTSLPCQRIDQSLSPVVICPTFWYYALDHDCWHCCTASTFVRLSLLPVPPCFQRLKLSFPPKAHICQDQKLVTFRPTEPTMQHLCHRSTAETAT